MASTTQLPGKTDDHSNERSQSSSSKRHNANTTVHNYIFGSHLGRVQNDSDRNRANKLENTENANNNNLNTELLTQLSGDFAQLLHRTDISDCILNVQGTYMTVHRCVLAARSNTFSAIISGNISRLDEVTRKNLPTTIDKDKMVISINKTDPDIMKQVIIFMYTANCELNQTNVYELLDAAGRYDIKSLKFYVGQFVINHIDKNNVLLLLRSAYKYDNRLVRQHCIQYFVEHAKEIVEISEEWKKFAEENPALVAELLYWKVNQSELQRT